MLIFLRYLVNPFKQITFLSKQLRMWNSAVAIICLSLLLLNLINYFSFPLLIGIFILLITFIILNVCIIDFLAQCLFKKSSGKILFKWFSLSFLLSIYLTPITLLQKHISPVLTLLLYIAFFSVLFRVQLHTIKRIYKINNYKAFLLLSGPSIITGASILGFTIFIFGVV